ncbi:hypothetical protein EWH99_08905 [Sporolactobacillus sp. THM7-7]|nr:hypothetical protein EWH99_08905 [Sporolactobacillus sp. THM7-7]
MMKIFNLEEILVLDLVTDWETETMGETLNEGYNYKELAGYTWIDGDFEQVYRITDELLKELLLRSERRDKMWESAIGTF